MDTHEAAFIDMPSSYLPVRVEFRDQDTGEVLRDFTITEAGAFTVPGRKDFDKQPAVFTEFQGVGVSVLTHPTDGVTVKAKTVEALKHLFR